LTKRNDRKGTGLQPVGILTEISMTTNELAFLILVIAALGTFAGALGYASWRG
jgi:hypothetical protein